MVNIARPTIGPTYIKVTNFPCLYRHSRSGRDYASKKLNGIRRECSLRTNDRKIAERRLKEWIGNMDKVDAGNSFDLVVKDRVNVELTAETLRLSSVVVQVQFTL